MGTLLHYVKKLKRKKAFFFKTLAVSNVIPTEKKRRRGGKKRDQAVKISCHSCDSHVREHVNTSTAMSKILHTVLFVKKKEKKKITKKTLKSD